MQFRWVYLVEELLLSYRLEAESGLLDLFERGYVSGIVVSALRMLIININIFLNHNLTLF